MSNDTTWVHCTVFLDENGDHARQATETGLGSVRVTNGLDVFLTDPSGDVDVPVADPEFHFVTMTVPAGHWPTGSFYHRIEPVRSEQAEFGLRVCPETSTDPVRFIHISDTHASTEPGAPSFLDALAAINDLPDPPFCIVNTGDLVERGSYASHWFWYVQQTAMSTLPVLNVVGNHDVDYPASLFHYELFVGPAYYSVDMGSWHFVIWNSEPGSPREAEWLVNDLDATAPGAKLAVFQHKLTSETPPEVLDLWASRGINSVFSGHWHCRQLAQRHPTIADYNQSWTVRGPIDRTARGFGIVTCAADGSIHYDMRRLGVDHRALLVSPFDGQAIVSPIVPVLLQLYDTGAHVSTASLTVNGPTGPPIDVPLSAEGISLWRGTLDLSANEDGAYTATATGTFEDGAPFSVEARFLLQRTPQAPASLGEDWPMFRKCASGTSFSPEPLRPPLALRWVADANGMTALSSPVVAQGRVVFGVRGEHTPQEAGVAAYDALTGQKLWFRHVPGGVGLAPAIAGGVVLVNSMADSTYGLDLATGARLWAVDKHTFGYDVSAPVFEGTDAWIGSEPFVLGIRWADGFVHWLSTWRGSSFYPFIYGAPAVTATSVYVGGFAVDYEVDNYSLAILSRQDGSIQAWENYGAWRSPICSGDTVFAVGGKIGNTYDPYQNIDIRSSNGALLHRSYQYLRTETDSPALGHGVLVVSGMPLANPGRNLGYDVTTGELIWSHEVGTELYDMTLGARHAKSTSSSPAIADDVVYVGGLDGKLYALDLYSGVELWSYFLGAPIASSPALCGDFLYVGAEDGHLYAFARSVEGQPPTGARHDAMNAPLEFARPSPNPGAEALFSWAQSRDGRVALTVYDVRGRFVRTLANSPFPAGRHQIRWDGRDAQGRAIADGVYFAKIEVDGVRAVRKWVHLRP